MRGLLANELGLRQTSDAVELATSDKIGLMAALKWKPFLSKPIHNENRASAQDQRRSASQQRQRARIKIPPTPFGVGAVQSKIVSLSVFVAGEPYRVSRVLTP